MALTDSQVRIASPNLRQEIRSRSRTPNRTNKDWIAGLKTEGGFLPYDSNSRLYLWTCPIANA
ncbi:hypothetical protein BD560DRAFT_409251 [Blakeslea trispora]|nr:hypothetical protein BD560DRAFT_409251 [Blakeslea trispora]